MINTTKKDVLWNYAATFLKLGSSIIILPLVLKVMPSETVGVWTIFMTITAFSSLLDFGFNPSFERNVTFVFSGVKELTVTGFEKIESPSDIRVDYGLLKSVIEAMRWIYLRMALILFVLLATIGTYYINIILQKYQGDKQEVYIAWLMLCSICTYNLFTLYYDALLQGKGMIKRAKQIVILGYVIYLSISVVLICFNFGLIALIAAQLTSTIVIRFLSHRSFFTREMKDNLSNVTARDKGEVLKTIYPNALKIGLTSLGGFVIQKSSMIIGALYLTLNEIASYGISMQLIAVLSSFASIYVSTFIPRIVHLRVINGVNEIKKIYFKGQFILLISYLFGGVAILFFGPYVLKLMGSKTFLLPTVLLILALFLSFIETNLSAAGSILLTKNHVPFFKASLISGFFIVLGLFVALKYWHLGVLGMILIPIIVNLSYQAWKWPWEVVKDLELKITDIKRMKNDTEFYIK